MVWDDEFVNNEHYKLFEKRVEKFGYLDVKSAVFEEVPRILFVNDVKKYFKIGYNMISLWDDSPQLYILLRGEKNG